MDIPDMPEPLCLIENLPGGFKINEEAFDVIKTILCVISVVTIVGPYRTGKSFLLNRLMGRNNGFPLGSGIESKTKGIWIWCRPHPVKKDQALVLLDIEGFGDVEKGSNTNDERLFLLAILLSSTLVYNNMNTINNDDINKLHFISELTNAIKVRSTTEEEDGLQFRQFFPDFIWTVRDFSVQLNLRGKSISADDYLTHALQLREGHSKAVSDYNLPRESIRAFFPSRKCFVFDRPVYLTNMLRYMENLEDDQLDHVFLEMVKRFCTHVFSNSMLKTCKGKALNGSSFCDLTKMYVDTVNSGSIPCLENTFQALAQIENKKALDEAVGVYMGIHQSLNLPAESVHDLSVLHQDFTKQAVDVFRKKVFADAGQQFKDKLMKITEEQHKEILEKNNRVSQKICKDLLKKYLLLGKELDQKVANGAYSEPGGYIMYSKDKEKVVHQYNSTPGKGPKVFTDAAKNPDTGRCSAAFTIPEWKSEDVLRKYLQRKETEGLGIKNIDDKMTEKKKELADERQASENAEKRETNERERNEKERNERGRNEREQRMFALANIMQQHGRHSFLRDLAIVGGEVISSLMRPEPTFRIQVHGLRDPDSDDD